MAGVRKKRLAGGLYQGWYKGLENGKVKRIFFTGTSSLTETRTIARCFEDKDRKILLGYCAAPTASEIHKSTLFAKVADEYIAWGEAQGGRNGYPWSKHHANRVRAMLKKFWAEQLRLEVMDDVYGILSGVEEVIRQEMAKGKAGKTIRLDVSALSAFCNWCERHDYLSANPLKKLTALKAEATFKRRSMNYDELQLIINVLVANRDEFGYWLVLLPLSCCTGLRSNAIKSLTINDLDADNCLLRLAAASSKNRKEGKKEISPDLVSLILDYYEAGIPEKLYAKHYARVDASEQLPKNPLVYVPSHPARELDKILKLAGVEKLTKEGKLDFHAMRVAYATFIFESGASYKEAQVAMDHSDPRLTANLYAKTRDERMHDLAERVANPVIDMIKCAYSVHEEKMTITENKPNTLFNNLLHENTNGGGGGNRIYKWAI